MGARLAAEIIARKYAEKFNAEPRLAFADYVLTQSAAGVGATLGYRRAGPEELFLERYLEVPVERAVSAAMGRSIQRERIVEIGNFAADNAMLILELWGSAANDLGAKSEIAVATLTAPLRRMLSRVGVSLTVLAPALASRLGSDGGDWGTYYGQDPQVCFGDIATGQAAIAAWRAKREGKAA